MALGAARRARWARIGDRRLPFAVAVLILLATPGAVMACPRAAVPSGIGMVQLTAVTVERQDEALTVRLQTGRMPRYTIVVLDAPPRIVIDLAATRYAWCGPLTANPEPIQQVRGSQWKPGTARVVVELNRPVGYSIEERPDGLVLRLPSARESPSAET